MSICITVTGIDTLTGWAAAMLLIYTWWQQLHSKRGMYPGHLLEDSSTPLRPPHHRSSLSLHRHHPSPDYQNLQLVPEEVQSEGQLDAESSGSDRGVLACTFKRRRPPTASTLPLLGQFVSLPHILLRPHLLLGCNACLLLGHVFN